MRHGKAEPGLRGADHERALAAVGTRDARRLGRFLTSSGRAPDRVWSSSAVRARETAEHARESGGWEAVVELRRELYETTGDAVVRLLREHAGEDGGPETWLLVGHEPTWSGLASRLSGGSFVSLPAGSAVGLEVAAWDELDEGLAVLSWLVAGRQLEDRL